MAQRLRNIPKNVLARLKVKLVDHMTLTQTVTLELKGTSGGDAGGVPS